MNLDESINELNRSIREQEELENRIQRTEWSSMNEDKRTKLEQQIAFIEKKQGQHIMRASNKSYRSYTEVLTKSNRVVELWF